MSRSKNMFQTLYEENRNRRILLYCAGPISTAFINRFSLKNIIDCVIDDNENKQQYFMPKSGLPIKSSSELYQNNPVLCLLAMNPAHQNKIISKHKNILGKCREFRTIYSLGKS